MKVYDSGLISLCKDFLQLTLSIVWSRDYVSIILEAVSIFKSFLHVQ